MKKALLILALVGASTSVQAKTWECSIIGTEGHKVILTQVSDPALSDEDSVKGTVTGPYGKKYEAAVSIGGFSRRWSYPTSGEVSQYSIFIEPNKQAGFYDFTGAENGESREPEYLLDCTEEEERRVAEEEKSETKLPAKGNQRGSNTLREAYKLAILQKVKRGWIRPAAGEKIPECWIKVLQGPGGIILDVTFGACKGSTAAYRSSIENAVYKADPLPNPAAPALFERELNFNFQSE